jgi:GxxExxY protein
MSENELATLVIECALHIHRTLGPGLLETVYEAILVYELRKRGLQVERQVPIPVTWGTVRLDEGFRADLVVEQKLVIELKAVERTAPVHSRQLLTYLRLMDKRLGLLINFGERLIRDGIHRVANSLQT